MEIKNETEAIQWLAAWDFKPRTGIAKETVRGLRIAHAISASYGNRDMAASYARAIAVIQPYAA